MQNAITKTLSAKFAPLEPFLDERTRRLWAAVEARTWGRGGIMRVAEATGLSRATIRAGLRELTTPPSRDVPQAAVLPRWPWCRKTRYGMVMFTRESKSLY